MNRNWSWVETCGCVMYAVFAAVGILVYSVYGLGVAIAFAAATVVLFAIVWAIRRSNGTISAKSKYHRPGSSPLSDPYAIGHRADDDEAFEEFEMAWGALHGDLILRAENFDSYFAAWQTVFKPAGMRPMSMVAAYTLRKTEDGPEFQLEWEKWRTSTVNPDHLFGNIEYRLMDYIFRCKSEGISAHQYLVRVYNEATGLLAPGEGSQQPTGGETDV